MKSKSKKVLGWGAAVVAIAAVGAGIASWQPSIAPLRETDHQTFSAEQIARGESSRRSATAPSAIPAPAVNAIPVAWR